MPDASFSEYVAEVESDPEAKRQLDEARARLRGDDPPTANVGEPRRPYPPPSSDGVELTEEV